MIKFHVLYPHSEGGRFDHAYYRDQHMPMVAQKLGSACLSYSIDKGLAGGGPGTPPPFFAACSITCASAESLQQAMAPHQKAIQADVANYTDARPVVWISEVVEPG
jgi:uncharacterized protein (TIGR02118 family)